MINYTAWCKPQALPALKYIRFKKGKIRVAAGKGEKALTFFQIKYVVAPFTFRLNSSHTHCQITSASYKAKFESIGHVFTTNTKECEEDETLLSLFRSLPILIVGSEIFTLTILNRFENKCHTI